MKINWKKLKEVCFGYDEVVDDENVTCVGIIPTVAVLLIMTILIVSPFVLKCIR